MITVQDWDDLVTSVYNRPYSFQQQDGCQDRGLFNITIPDEPYDFENDSIPEEVNGDEMGVSFKSWLERDPKLKLYNKDDDSGITLFWERNFYPDIQMIDNDLNNKGLIPNVEFTIIIDW